MITLFGTSWLMHSSSNQELIINSVAIFFITHIDEMIYKSFIPSPISRAIEEIPPLHWPVDDNGLCVVCSTLFGGILQLQAIQQVQYASTWYKKNSQKSNHVDIPVPEVEPIQTTEKQFEELFTKKIILLEETVLKN